MKIYPNHTKQQLEAGKIAIGMGLHQSRTTDIGAIAKTCGYDWLFIDMEHSALDALAAAPQDSGVAAWIQYNRNFHLALARASGNSRLTRATTDVIEQFDRLIYMNMSNVLREAGNLQQFVDEHTAIVAAIRRRDKRAAVTLTREHVESSQALLLEQIGALAVVP